MNRALEPLSIRPLPPLLASGAHSCVCFRHFVLWRLWCPANYYFSSDCCSILLPPAAHLEESETYHFLSCIIKHRFLQTIHILFLQIYHHFSKG